MKNIDKMLSELNDKQREAVTHEGSHALVLAGAGCGKTKTIISRASYLISKGVDPKRILILTFTRRSAAEIVERVESYMGVESEGLKATTFHSWCLPIIKQRGHAFGVKGFSIIDSDDQIQLFKSIQKDNEYELFPNKSDIRDAYSYARNTLSDPKLVIEDKFPEFYDVQSEILLSMKIYEAKKKYNKYIDYDDILDIVAKGFLLSPNICKSISSEYDHILVDEMQDTNPLQWSILEPLAKYVKLFCVGDDAQSIYGFRGADFKNVHSFKEKLPDATVIKLEMNYRSTQEILDISNWLLAQSPIAYDKRLSANKGSGIKPILQTFNDEWEEGPWIADDLVSRKNNGNDWKDFMLLIRSKSSARKLENSLMLKNIPYVIIGGRKLLEAAHIKDVLSVLRVIANYRDEIGWMRFLTIFPGIGESKARSIIRVTDACMDLDEVINELTKNSTCPDEVVKILKTLHQIENYVLESVSKAVSMLKDMLSMKYRNDWNKRKMDFKYLEKLATKHTSIQDFITEYLLDPVTISEVEKKENDDVVKIITIHSAKGTESKICYVVEVSPGAFPSSRNVGSLDEVEEERRVLYVALTRAMDELIITRKGPSYWTQNSRTYIQACNNMNKLNEKCEIESYFFNDLPDYTVNEEIHRSTIVDLSKNRNDQSLSYYGLFSA